MLLQLLQNYLDVINDTTQMTQRSATAMAHTMLRQAGMEPAADLVSQMSEQLIAAQEAQWALMRQLIQSEVDMTLARMPLTGANAEPSAPQPAPEHREEPGIAEAATPPIAAVAAPAESTADAHVAEVPSAEAPVEDSSSVEAVDQEDTSAVVATTDDSSRVEAVDQEDTSAVEATTDDSSAVEVTGDEPEPDTSEQPINSSAAETAPESLEPIADAEIQPTEPVVELATAESSGEESGVQALGEDAPTDELTAGEPESAIAAVPAPKAPAKRAPAARKASARKTTAGDQATPRTTAAKSTTPRTSTAGSAAPKTTAAKSATPKTTSAKSTTPRTSTAGSATPRTTAAKSASPKTTAAKSTTPRTSAAGSGRTASKRKAAESTDVPTSGDASTSGQDLEANS